MAEPSPNPRPVTLKESLTWCTTPPLAMETHGSVARSHRWPGCDVSSRAVPRAQRENSGTDFVHVTPPSVLTALTLPGEPPLSQRSCCHAATTWLPLAGSTAR